MCVRRVAGEGRVGRRPGDCVVQRRQRLGTRAEQSRAEQSSTGRRQRRGGRRWSNGGRDKKNGGRKNGRGCVGGQESSRAVMLNSWHFAQPFARRARSDFRLALALAGGQCLIARCEATSNMTTGPAPAALRQFQCSRTCWAPFTTALRCFSRPKDPIAAILGYLVCVARARRGRLRVWIKNRRHASPSHTNSPSSPGAASCCGSQSPYS